MLCNEKGTHQEKVLVEKKKNKKTKDGTKEGRGVDTHTRAGNKNRSFRKQAANYGITSYTRFFRPSWNGSEPSALTSRFFFPSKG